MPSAALTSVALYFVMTRTMPPEVKQVPETFEARDFVRTGLVLTIIAFVLVMLLSVTYWRWLGYV